MGAEELFSTDSQVMMSGFDASIGAALERSGIARMMQVRDVFMPYVNGEKTLPIVTTPQIVRFFIISAALGLWGEMDKEDPLMAEVLLAYYDQGLTYNSIAGAIEGIKYTEQVRRLRHKGLKWLFDRIPDPSEEFPIDKYKEFDLSELKATSQLRQMAALEPHMGTMRGDSKRARAMVLRRFYVTEAQDQQDEE